MKEKELRDKEKQEEIEKEIKEQKKATKYFPKLPDLALYINTFDDTTGTTFMD